MNTYMDFAENDYAYFQHSYNSGYVANAMAADAQEICEKYMKHIIDTFCNNVSSSEEDYEFQSVMKSHNLQKLFRYIENHTDCSFSDETKQKLRAVNGYYFSARYPGDESIEVTKSDLDLCNETLIMCRKEILEMQIKLENERTLFSTEVTEADIAELKSSNDGNDTSAEKLAQELTQENSDDTLPVSEQNQSNQLSNNNTEGEDEEFDL